MNEKNKLRIVGMTLVAMGLFITYYHLGFWPTAGLFIFACGNNIEQSIKES